jgi:hypothetical protein
MEFTNLRLTYFPEPLLEDEPELSELPPEGELLLPLLEEPGE